MCGQTGFYSIQAPSSRRDQLNTCPKGPRKPLVVPEGVGVRARALGAEPPFLAKKQVLVSSGEWPTQCDHMVKRNKGVSNHLPLTKPTSRVSRGGLCLNRGQGILVKTVALSITHPPVLGL